MPGQAVANPARSGFTGYGTTALRRELAFARAQTDSLFGLIGPETLYARPIAERHRLIFYLGHFEAFDWNLLARRGLNAHSFYPAFDSLFERGIDPAPGQAPLDSPRDWPNQTEVEHYKGKTRAWIDSHLDDLDPWVLQMAIEHRHMHAETFAYLLHGLPYHEKKRPTPTVERTPDRPAPSNPMITIDAGSVTLGQSKDHFGWDNEHLAHDVVVPAFRISKFKISNGEYLDFVRDGGPAPHFWVLENNMWFCRGMFSQFPLPLDWPVWVTWRQASAYAEWRGLTLPTEAQFQRAAELTSPDSERDNFGYHRWDPVSVDGRAGDLVAGGLRPAQLVGNGWEWTRDPFAPFDGFEPHPLYPGYSADFFDGQHYVMKGASPRTASILTRPSFRNWFRSDYPYMYTGFRLLSEANSGEAA
jgi:formylglycine-generating enzyme required for sulfatase activity